MVVEKRHGGNVVHEMAHHDEGEATAMVLPGGSTPSKQTKPKRPRRKRSTSSARYYSRRIWDPPTVSLGLWGSRCLLMLVTCMYSTNFACVKYLETLCLSPPCDRDPAEATFTRFLVSACACLPILLMNRKQFQLISAGMECGLWYTINYITQAESLEIIPASRCSFISSLSVVSIPLLSAAFMGKPIHPMTLVSAVIALFGVGILENLIPLGGMFGTSVAAPEVLPGGTFLGISIGDILAMGQPLGFGYAVVRIDYFMEKFAHIPSMQRILTMTAAQCITVCVLTFCWVLFDQEKEGHFGLPDLSYMLEFHHILTLAWTGIVTCVGAVFLQGIALQKASATDASLIFSSEPIWGSLFAWWLLNEKMSRTAYVGGFFICVACVLGSLRGGGGHGGGSPSSTTLDETTTARKKNMKKKNSFDSLEPLLPTQIDHVDPDMMIKPGLRTEGSVPSLADVKDYPTC